MVDKEYRLLQRRRLFSETFPIWWLKKLAGEYKEHCALPLSLCDYYDKKEDIEVAAVVECLLREPLDDSPKRNDDIIELRNIIGKNPSEMVRTRNFLHILPSDEKDIELGSSGILLTDIFNTLDWIWEIRVKIGATIEDAITKKSYPSLSERIERNIPMASTHLLLMRMCLDDGIGKGIWHSVSPEDIPCPQDKSLIRLVRKLYSVGRMREEDLDEVVSFLGFDIPCEFVYAYWGYRKLGDAMDAFERIFPNLINGKMSFRSWKDNYHKGADLLPKIEFLEK